MKDFKLTDHFWLREFRVSWRFPELAEALNPTPVQINNMYFQCATILEPVRRYLGCPIYISRGFASPELNAAVGGSVRSLHMRAKAADVWAEDTDRTFGIYEFIQAELPYAFSQLIYYAGMNVVHSALPHPGYDQFTEIRA